MFSCAINTAKLCLADARFFDCLGVRPEFDAGLDELAGFWNARCKRIRRWVEQQRRIEQQRQLEQRRIEQ